MTDPFISPERSPNRYEGDGPQPPTSQSSSQPQGVDVEQLAERVYRLMRDDLRLERARRGWD